MADILNLLFDQYTQGIEIGKRETESRAIQTRFQQLKELAGEEEAIDIWDAAVGEGAVMQEVYFQAGLKTGIALALELLSL